MLQKMMNRKGFTLVELMIVVAIIGILAAIAIPNFLQFRLKAKTSEAKSNLGAIRSTEVAYFAEWNFYVGNSGINPRTVATLDGAKAAWSAATTFSIIGFAPEGQVYYSYELQPAATKYSTQTGGFSALAYGDLDDDATIASFEVNTSGGELIKTGGDF
jgi:type IV pilus assembly protein PilA